MANELSIKSLLTGFPIPTKDDWIKVAGKETGHANPIDVLRWKLNDELSFLPIYDANDLYSTNDRTDFDLLPAEKDLHGTRAWLNQPPVGSGSPASANQEALLHLAHGADGILFTCSDNPDYHTMLKAVDLTASNVSFHFEHEADIGQLVSYLGAMYPDKQVDSRLSWETAPARPDSLLRELMKRNHAIRGLGLRVKQMDDPTEEIAGALAEGVKWMDRLTEAGLSPAEISTHIHFLLTTRHDFFLTIATLKALRILWFQILGAYGLSKRADYAGIFIHSLCKPLKSMDYEPHGSMISGTTESLAAICGGCDALTVFTEPEKTTVSKRVGRNIGSILREESHLDKVADPIAGSYFVEAMLHSLTRSAWDKFKRLVNQNEA